MFCKSAQPFVCLAFLLSFTAASLGDDSLFFQAPQIYNSAGYYAQSIAVADVNRDGKLDIVVANWCITYPNNCHGVAGVLLGNGDGSFQAAQSYDSGGYYAQSIAVADVNGDGKPDLLVANECLSDTVCYQRPWGKQKLLPGGVGVLLGNGDGTFRAAQNYWSGGNLARSIAVADVNRDGKQDVLVANSCSSNGDCEETSGLGVLLGNGDGTFQTAQAYSSGAPFAHAIAVGDVNGDGNPDMLVANWCLSALIHDCDSGPVGVLLGNGDGTFQPARLFGHSLVLGTAIAVGDVNGDGNLDVLVGIQDALSFLLLGNGDGTFQAPQGRFMGGRSIAVQDVNRDGNLDVLVPIRIPKKRDVGLSLGNGNGSFQTAQIFRSGGPHSSSIAVGDVNGDGKPDLLVANKCLSSKMCESGSVAVLLRGFETTTTLSSSVNPSALGQAVTFTAMVTSTGPTPTGIVKFMDGTTAIGWARLSGGVAKRTKSTLAAGTHPITAQYVGDAASGKSTSPALDQVVE